MEPLNTSVLRNAAPEWSLAGDKHLLQVLEQMHQKIISKCQEVNRKLHEMVNTLDNASIDLQNVNNKFMALSNSQFIESRVYDDDVISDVDSEKKTAPPLDQESELSKIKRSLQTLEAMHETVRILDSDSSDEDDDFRTILKPKDVYSSRPLPYIIDSPAWRTKWHVGLVPSDSESDSSTEFVKNEISRDQYSESESEDEPNQQTGRDVSMISSNSEVESEPSPATRPADIAAQIAKRLTAQRPINLEPGPREEPVPETVPRKVYRAESLVPATVFSDEPPPLEESDGDYSDDDIFAELHKKPTTSRQQHHPRGFESRNVVDDLFGDQLFDDESKVEDVRPSEKVKTGAKDTTLNEEDLDSNLFTPKEVIKPKSPIAPTEQATKKPIGGMSLFGSSKGAESIGAAILKRNLRRKSSSSEESSIEVEEHKQTVTSKKPALDATNKFIEDLFSKPKSNKKDTETNRDDKSQEEEKPVKAKIDLFSDNIFDDIDDIFTTEVVTKPKESLKGPRKSIFDEDELFADIPIKTSINNKNKDNLFDSDDELFKEDNLNVDGNKNKNLKSSSESKIVEIKGDKSHRETSTEKSIFGEDNDDIFGVNNSPILQNQINTIINVNAAPSWPNEDNLEDPVINSDKLKDSKNCTGKESHMEITINVSKSLSDPTLPKIITSSVPKQFESPLLFGEDEIDDLFIKNTKRFESNENRTKDISTKGNKEKDIFDNTSKNEGVVTESKTQNKILKYLQQEGNNNDLSVQDVDDNNKLYTNSQIVNKQFSLKKHEEGGIKSVSAESTVLIQNLTEQININTDDDVFNDINSSKFMGTMPSVTRQENNQNDMLDDIFSDLPPAFEKPSEPKKSKNVNALFDDDSDDEALFFKKNDVTEEKPEVTYKDDNDDRFRIFHDEPPDIDVDFSRKSKDNVANTVESNEELFNVPEQLVSDELISEKNSPKPKENELSSHTNKERKTFSHTETRQQSEDTSLNISKLLDSVNIKTDNDKLDYKTLDTKEDDKNNITPENDTFDRETNTRKPIGKLKPMNININVNSLLPGASPTKQKPKDESDGLVFSTKSNEELNIFAVQKEESKIVKSVSFDGDPESNVLNNQLSKGRAKIQVKRRPSSRRARLEAVRKSGIDFGDDSTDNSGSFDEPGPKIDAVDIVSEMTSTDTINDYNKEDEEKQSKRQIKIIRNDDKKSPDKNLDTVQNIVNPETKSKTVYILHDEDIFADSPVTHTATSKKTLTIEDDDELFKNPMSKSVKNNELNTQKPLEDKTRTLTILDDDDDLFKNPVSKVIKKDVESNTQKSLKDETKTLKILDDDDGDKLFKNLISESVKYEIESNTKLEDKVNQNNGAKEKPNTSAKSKKSIFDDLSDDDDELFGGKKSSGMTSNDDILYKKSKTDNTKVLDKPKSLFGDDSDDDLFKTAKSSDVKPTKTKETTSTVSKPVMNDPLSLFDDS